MSGSSPCRSRQQRNGGQETHCPDDSVPQGGHPPDRNRKHNETPLFVGSELTGMVQVAYLCGYAHRRYLENGEEELFDLVFQRADRKGDIAVGVRQRHLRSAASPKAIWTSP